MQKWLFVLRSSHSNGGWVKYEGIVRNKSYKVIYICKIGLLKRLRRVVFYLPLEGLDVVCYAPVSAYNADDMKSTENKKKGR